MLTSYLTAALRKAHYELLPEDKEFYGEIPGFPGVYANAKSLEACRDELASTLEDRLLFRISRNLSLPVVDGMELSIKQVA